MLGLGVGYFLWYTPYSGLAKAMSSGLLATGPVGGLVLLPAAALGTLFSMPVALTILRWWGHARRRKLLGLTIPFPGWETAMSAVWTSLIVGTTTLNFTFPGVSILLMLVLMRIETLIVSPTMDFLRRRKIHGHSWVAVVLSALSAVVALADVGNYQLTSGAVASLLGYVIGYANRFFIMSRHAKYGDLLADRRYLVEEHMTTPVMLVAILAVPALLDQGPAMRALRTGFTTFLATPAALPAFVIGVLYEGLFLFTTLIFLDRREYSFCVPVHVCSSLLAGVAAAFALTAIFGVAPPSAAQFVAVVCVVLAAFALSYPTIRAARLTDRRATRKLLVFVCGQNNVRSPMAAAIARFELARANAGPEWDVTCAGVTVGRPGTPMPAAAMKALRQLGIHAPPHFSRELTRQMCADSTAIYCMTRRQREIVAELTPSATDRVLCLDPNADVPEPGDDGVDSYRDSAGRIHSLVRNRLRELLVDCRPATSGGA
jgi:protein-tyrosine-phosphatase